MEDLDALLADLENTTSPLARCPVLLTSDPPINAEPVTQDSSPVRPPPPAYTPQQTVSAAIKSSQNPNPDKLYSTVCKPRSPRAVDPPPAFSSSSLLGGGLSELDHLLQELNATQFNISDEILAQFPSPKKDDKDKVKDKTTTPSSAKPSATSATLELDKLMASLSDFRVQSTVSL